jgi:hypothetical protein
MRSASSTRFAGDDPELASYLRIEERELEAVVDRTDFGALRFRAGDRALFC